MGSEADIQSLANAVTVTAIVLILLLGVIVILWLRFKPKTKPRRVHAVTPPGPTTTPTPEIPKWSLKIPKGIWKPLVWIGIITCLILFFGVGNIIETGNNVGTAIREASRGLNENGPLPTTGQIELERTFGNPQVFALADTYRRIDVPPGAELCADPIHMVDQGQESTPAVRYVRSNIEGVVVNIHFYFMPYGESCVLLPPSLDPRARTEENSNYHLTHT